MENKINKLRILELCHFSAGGCGVWARARQESELFSKKGHEVLIISSNLEKGSDRVLPFEESIGKIRVLRYPTKRLGGESFMFWFGKEALQKAIEFRPDIILVHNYRHLHTTKALKLAKILKSQKKSCKVFLVTHAPFVEGNITRTKLQKVVIALYDNIIGKATLNRFDKILAISKWEIPYLIKAGARRDKIVYIPNGIPSEFFYLKNKTKEENKFIFLGRVAPKKKIETVISSILYLKNKNILFEVIGPREEDYYKSLKNLINKLGIQKRVIFSEPIYDLKEKIKKIDSSKVYILASRVEGMPQGLIEAMARRKIVIGSDSLAIRDLIQNNENGYLFDFDNPRDLAKKIDFAFEDTKKNKNIKKKARLSVTQFDWNKVIERIESLF